MFKCGVISGPYFPVLGLNTGKYGPEITPYLDTFHGVTTSRQQFKLSKSYFISPLKEPNDLSFRPTKNHKNLHISTTYKTRLQIAGPNSMENYKLELYY